MTLNKKHNETGIIFTPAGRLDSISSPELQDALITAFNECPNITLDFENLTYISSAGLRVVLMAHKTAVGHKGSLTILRASDSVREVLTLTGFADMIGLTGRK